MTKIGVSLLACLVSSLVSADEFTLFCIRDDTKVEGEWRSYFEDQKSAYLDFHLEVDLDAGYVHLVKENVIHRLNDPKYPLTVTPYLIELGGSEQDFWMHIDRKDGSYFVRSFENVNPVWGHCRKGEELIFNTLF